VQDLTEAISKIFANRSTELPSKIGALINELKHDPPKEKQWVGFKRKNKLNNAPDEFNKVLDDISSFLSLPVKAIKVRHPCESRWNAPGPWVG
jgi:hypothetical protein